MITPAKIEQRLVELSKEIDTSHISKQGIVVNNVSVAQSFLRFVSLLINNKELFLISLAIALSVIKESVESILWTLLTSLTNFLNVAIIIFLFQTLLFYLTYYHKLEQELHVLSVHSYYLSANGLLQTNWASVVFLLL